MIEDWRKDIDYLDQELMCLLEKRFALSQKIGHHKKCNGLAILDPKRELEILSVVAEKVQDKMFVEPLQLVYKNIMEASRQVQAKPVVRVAYQGTQGAYGEEALNTFFAKALNDLELHAMPLQDFENVVEGVAEGAYDYGVLPIENTTTGGILPVYDLIQKHAVTIVGEVLIPIDHQLLVVPGTKLEDIEMVYSHPQALRQSRNYLRAGGWQLQPYANTALSARMVAELGDPTKAAVGSKRAAEVYGLEILAPSIHDQNGNMTRFVILSAESHTGQTPLTQPLFEGENGQSSHNKGKTSFVVTIPHKSGSLYKVIACLKDHDVNMLKIESRPLENHPFEYSFHIDVEGFRHEPPVQGALLDLEKMVQTLKVLGSYADYSHSSIQIIPGIQYNE